jgi:hypothetical protein
MIKGTRRSPEARRKRSKALPVVVAAALAALGLVYFHFFAGFGGGKEPVETPPAPEAAEMAAVPPEPAESQPAEGAEEEIAPEAPEEAISLPSLDESDALVRERVGGLSARPELRAWLTTPDLVRRFVAGVASVAVGESPREQLLFLAPKQGFQVVPRDGGLVADPRTHARYDLAADVFTSLDVPALVRAYRLLSPLFEAAFGDLGLPDRGFAETLHRAIRELLEAPLVEAPVELRRVGNLYEYADEELEGLSQAQRHLLRMGPGNALRIQAKLREIQAALAAKPSGDRSG